MKNGAVALEPIRYYYRPVRWAPATLESSMDVVDSWLPAASDLATEWTSAALRWRLDARTGNEYSVSRMSQAAASHGVVHRTVPGRLRTLVVVSEWGDAAAVARTVRALAWQEKALLVLAPSGEGTAAVRPRISRARGRSLVCVWDDPSDGSARSRALLSGWVCALDLGGLL